MIVSTELDIDFDLLCKQKEALVHCAYSTDHQPLADKIEGVIGLLDAIQDQAAERFGAKAIFG